MNISILSFVVCTFGILTRILYQIVKSRKSVKKRNQERVASQAQSKQLAWSLSFFLTDNIYRVVLGFIVSYAVILFAPPFLVSFVGEWSLAHSYVAGLVVYQQCVVWIPKLDERFEKYLD